jgi:hypothetical protein
MMYESSKGPVEISTMPLSYAKNALNKLRRTEPGRTEEIEALAAHVERLEAEATEQALAAPDNPRAVIGDNNPPVETPAAAPEATWEAIKVHLDDLLTEAANWADGIAIENDDQSAAVATLQRSLQDAVTLADKARVAEKKPLDDLIEEIQNRYNAYIAPLKNRAPGSASKAIAALQNLLTAWLTKKDDERRQREREAAAAAAKAAAEALTAKAEAKETTDLEVMDRAEDKLAEAEQLIRQAKGVASEKVQARGEGRAIGLRSYWSAEITDQKAAILHYMKTRPEAFIQLTQQLASEDARNEATRCTIPGVQFIEELRAA